jgi:hypothetical protein
MIVNLVMLVLYGAVALAACGMVAKAIVVDALTAHR